MTLHTRLRTLARAAALATALATIGTIGTTAHANDVAAGARPSVVIVHGAFADGSDWARVNPLLQARGVKVTAARIH